jgi:hypothetical protein
VAGAVTVTGQLPPSPSQLFFGCWRSLRSCGRRKPVHLGKGWEIPGGNQRRRSAVGNFPYRRPRRRRGWTGWSGHVQSVGQQPKNVVDTPGDGGQELCDGPAAPGQPAAQRTSEDWLERSGNGNTGTAVNRCDSSGNRRASMYCLSLDSSAGSRPARECCVRRT